MGERVCPVEGCTKRRTHARHCQMHARRLWAYGSLDDPPQTASYKRQVEAMQRLRTPEALLDGECWEWPGPRQNKGAGYGLVAPSLQVITSSLAHRNAYAVAFGDIPDDKLACHHCDNPPCFRPSHLFAGTVLDNARDMIAKGRHRTGPPRRGIISTQAAFTLADVAAIIRLRELGWLHREIAAEYGVSESCVGRLLRGQTKYRSQLEVAS